VQDERTTLFPLLAIRHGVLVLDGYGLRVSVERGHLAVSDGIGDERRQGRFPRATCGLRRLVLLGHSGSITLEALRWMHDVGAAVVQIDADGKIILASGPAGTADARLLRAQVVASQNGVGLRIVRDLLREKLRGQAAALDRLPGAQSAASEIRRIAGTNLEGAATLDRLRALEAEAAAIYWKTWEPVPVRFARRDARSVPDYWRRFGSRHSLLTGSPRNAMSPANSLLNYLYAVAETETRIAAQAVGMAPQVGLLHADQRFRDSLVFDLLEVIRPEVDAFLLNLLQTHTFAKADFTETRQGVCRVLAPLTHVLAETAPTWARAIAPVVERVAQALMKDADHAPRTRAFLPTPLTQAHRSAGREGLRHHPRPAVPAPDVPPACRNCGVLLDRADRLYCGDCVPERRSEVGTRAAVTGRQVLADLRRRGQDPAHGGNAGRVRGEKIRRHNREQARWKDVRSGTVNARLFHREILPRLHQMSLRRIARALGVSEGYASFIRRGLRIPHPRHWEVLKALTMAATPRSLRSELGTGCIFGVVPSARTPRRPSRHPVREEIR
jgi:CRISPR-associated endonuclease Cas1